MKNKKGCLFVIICAILLGVGVVIKIKFGDKAFDVVSVAAGLVIFFVGRKFFTNGGL